MYEIQNIIKKCNNITIQNILNISPEEYLKTAILYEVFFDFIV